MSKGRAPNLTEKLAAALLTFQRPDENGQLVPCIEWERAKTMTAKQIIAAFECDHDPIAKWMRDGVPINDPWNLTWRPKAEHREKTNKRDIPAAAKSKRIIAKRDDTTKSFRDMVLSKRVETARAPFKSRFKRKLNGKVVERAYDR